jgi:hypothetical protein
VDFRPRIRVMVRVLYRCHLFVLFSFFGLFHLFLYCCCLFCMVSIFSLILTFIIITLLVPRNSNHIGNDEMNASQETNVTQGFIENERDYRNLIALVSGAIVNRQFDCHMDDTLDQVHDMSYLKERTNDNIFDQDQLNSLGLDSIENISDIPTIKKICMKAATERGIFLDRIQYVAYEIICSTFLLDIVKTTWKEEDELSSGISVSDRAITQFNTMEARQKLLDSLYDLGAKDQLLMYITGPAGAGKVLQLM